MEVLIMDQGTEFGPNFQTPVPIQGDICPWLTEFGNAVAKFRR